MIGYAQNTGIGTTTPTAKLDINGNLRVRTLPTVTDTNLYNIVLSEANGDVSSVKAADFVSQLKVPSTVFNAQQNSNLSTALPTNNTTNRTIFSTVNINKPGSGSWESNLNRYTVSKKGIYTITAGVYAYQVSTDTAPLAMVITTDKGMQTVGGINLINNEASLNATYVVLLDVNDTIVINTIKGDSGTYKQGKAYINIVYTPL